MRPERRPKYPLGTDYNVSFVHTGIISTRIGTNCQSPRMHETCEIHSLQDPTKLTKQAPSLVEYFASIYLDTSARIVYVIFGVYRF